MQRALNLPAFYYGAGSSSLASVAMGSILGYSVPALVSMAAGGVHMHDALLSQSPPSVNSAMHRHPLVILLTAMLAAIAKAEPTRWAWATVERRVNRLVIYDGEPPQANSFAEAPHVPVAWASFKDDIHESGWSYLQIESSPYVHDELQAYAAGALEAYLTRQLMENQWENLFSRYCENQTQYCSRLNEFIVKNLAHSHEQQHRFKYSDPYWNMVRMVNFCNKPVLN
ncbi:hypothetical protein HPB49_008803 [Dermacentor silvarum]|uniref:Uncharacterized protein n=1 Tax=Dermacentor silvarum TaxID=543639 RepID=A0ACB8DXS4_DERSI|nr:hypothetical protein HPB49_008803 [Dermacentor silvarum]